MNTDTCGIPLTLNNVMSVQYGARGREILGTPCNPTSEVVTQQTARAVNPTMRGRRRAATIISIEIMQISFLTRSLQINSLPSSMQMSLLKQAHAGAAMHSKAASQVRLTCAAIAFLPAVACGLQAVVHISKDTVSPISLLIYDLLENELCLHLAPHKLPQATQSARSDPVLEDDLHRSGTRRRLYHPSLTPMARNLRSCRRRQNHGEEARRADDAPPGSSTISISFTRTLCPTGTCSESLGSSSSVFP
jgi:hypothetical protein